MSVALPTMSLWQDARWTRPKPPWQSFLARSLNWFTEAGYFPNALTATSVKVFPPSLECATQICELLLVANWVVEM